MNLFQFIFGRCPVLTVILLSLPQVDSCVSPPHPKASNVPGSVCDSCGCDGGSGGWFHRSASLPPFRQQVTTTLLVVIGLAAGPLLRKAHVEFYTIPQLQITGPAEESQ